MPDDIFESRQDRGISAVLQAMEEFAGRLIVADTGPGPEVRRRLTEAAAAEMAAIRPSRHLLAATAAERRPQVVDFSPALPAQGLHLLQPQGLLAEEASGREEQIEADRPPALLSTH
jgi:hypothetical protein